MIRGLNFNQSWYRFTLLDRYIGITVASSILIALLVLVSLEAFITFMAELRDVGKNDYGVTQAMVFVLLTIPRRLYEYFPTSALLGSIMGLGVLASHSELVVMRSAGLSILRLVFSIFKTGGLIMLFVFIIGEVVAPVTEQNAQNYRSTHMDDRVTMQSIHGLWVRDGLSFINVKTVLPGERMGDIRIHEFDENHKLRVTTYAESAEYKDEKWVLSGIKQSIIDESGITIKTSDSATWNSILSPDLLNVVKIKPEILSMWALGDYIEYLQTNKQDASRYQLAFWTKLIAPLATGVMILLAVPFVFGPLRNVSMGQRVLVGVMLGIAFHIMNQMFGQMSQIYNFNPFFGASLPTVVFLVGTVMFIKKVR
ncbi:MAG: LPS export ABC transporter permease LptG [Gammaproteobacteria bacterium]|nr:LPS export ABC transporter permease LptG [Gammaproteobacteria bacterium]MDH5592912.1 LPS export ABC transporter permease LptG [Gammaproteobacteria bacterium]